MSKEFFNTNEKRDYELFEELMNDVAPNTEKGAAPVYCYCDATGKTMGDITIEFELKYRTYNFNEDKMVMEKNGKEYSEIIIEAHKIAELLISNQLCFYSETTIFVSVLFFIPKNSLFSLI